MNTKKIIIIIFSFVIIFTSLSFGILASDENNTGKEEFENAREFLRSSIDWSNTTYADIKSGWESFSPGSGLYEALPGEDENYITTQLGESAYYNVQINQSGLYNISILYVPVDRSLTANTVSLKINGQLPFDEAEYIELPTIWEDESKEFLNDRFGNESIPRSIPLREWRSQILRVYTAATSQPLAVYLDEGTNLIEITNRANPLSLGKLAVSPDLILPEYDEYINSFDYLELAELPISIGAVEYVEKNSSYINLMAIPNPDLEPFESGRRKLNAIEGEGYNLAGQDISFRVDIPETGLYKISLKYSTTVKDAFIYRSIMIDGKIPFKQAGMLPIPPTGGKFETGILSHADGRAYEFMLEEGSRLITLSVVSGPAAQAITDLTMCLDHINLFSQQIRRITGREIDENRTWRLTSYLPLTADYLESYITVLNYYYNSLSSAWGENDNPAELSNLRIAIRRLEQLALNPDSLPVRLNAFQTGTGSVAELIGVQIETLKDQPMTLNSIDFFGLNPPESTKKSIIVHIREWILNFIATFKSNDLQEVSDESLNVWVNRPVQQVDLIRKLTDALFADDTGENIVISYSHLSNEGRLILARASGTAPDVVIGLSGWIPYELAIRGSGYDLTRFPDFWEFASQFAPGAFIPLVYEKGVYAIPESMDFQALFYRRDILDSIGLEIPDTWDDVIDMLPELQRNGMGFYHHMAVNSAYKWFNITYVDLAQFQCQLYTPDGMSVNLSSPEGLAALDFQTKLFTTYSMPEQVASFYQSFRRGTIPIGIGNFYTYVQLKSAAPEIAGQWGIALIPGQKDPEGNILRWTPGLATTSFLFEEVKNPEIAWTFMKWWLSEEIQSEFGYRLQSVFGPSYMYLPANLNSVESLPVEFSDREIIRKQLDWIAEPAKTPATYMVERGISDIWNMVVFDGIPIRIAVDRMQIEMNRELRRKLEEFGYISQGEMVRPYEFPTVEEIRKEMEKYG